MNVAAYQQPGRNGEVIGELKAGTQGVSLAEPSRADNWCHLKGNVPNGDGWVWSDPWYQALRI